MNVQGLRQSLKFKWLQYYRENRHWMEKMQIWATFEEERRPLSSFILATVTVMEPELIDMLPLLAELNSDPDAMVAALGLNFNPETELALVQTTSSNSQKETIVNENLVEQPESGVQLRVAIASSYLKQVRFGDTLALPSTNSTQIVKVFPGEVNQAPIIHPRNLSNWIDDFCQGRDLKQEDAVFIPF
jgi:hypothetical protein